MFAKNLRRSVTAVQTIFFSTPRVIKIPFKFKFKDFDLLRCNKINCSNNLMVVRLLSTVEKSELNNDGSSINCQQPNQSSINVDDEMLRYDYEEYEEMDEDTDEEVDQDLPDYLTKRGVTGVYDLDDLCKLLESEKAQDVVCIPISPEFRYCDHMVILTGKSKRHLRAMAERIKKIFKLKRGSSDPESVNIEGLLATDWLALDLGNIVVHLFLEETRLKYNLEELWTIGPELDSHCNEEEEERNLESVKQDGLTFNKNFSFDEELERIKKLRMSEKMTERNKKH